MVIGWPTAGCPYFAQNALKLPKIIYKVGTNVTTVENTPYTDVKSKNWSFQRVRFPIYDISATIKLK